MNFFVLISCAFAVISAEYQAPYHGPLHIPVIGPNGVPLEPPEVQQARSAHLAALSGTGAHGGAYSGAAYAQSGAGPVGQYVAPSAPVRYTPPAYPTSHVVPAIGANGVPQDTPEVQAATANHFAAYSQAHAALGQAASAAAAHGGHGYGHYRKRRSLYSGPWAHAGAGYAAPVVSHTPPAYPTSHGLPAIAANGQPIDTPEVSQAKADHFAAFAEASARNGVHGGVFGGLGHGAYGPGPAAYGAGYGYAAYPQHIPVIDSNGVPVDTPAVQHARAAHFAAYSEAAARSGAGYAGHGGYAGPWAYGSAAIGHDGAPLDTPAVQAAKAAHFAAHAAAGAHHY